MKAINENNIHKDNSAIKSSIFQYQQTNEEYKRSVSRVSNQV